MLSTEELVSRIDQAIKAITTTTLGDTRLHPEKAERFIQAAQSRTRILPEARFLEMRSDKRDIDRVGFSSRIMGPGTEGTAPSAVNPAFARNQLSAVLGKALVELGDEALEDNIEREDFEDTLIDLIAARAGLDFEELGVQGDTDSEDTWLELTNGWLKKAGNEVDGTVTDTADGYEGTLDGAHAAGTTVLSVDGIASAELAEDDVVRIGAGNTQEYHLVAEIDATENTITLQTALKHHQPVGAAVVEIDDLPSFNPHDVEALFEAMLTALPVQYREDLEGMNFWVPWDIENDYRDVLRQRGTALGDQAQRDRDPVSYKGIRVRWSANVAAGKALLSHNDNMVWGMRRDIRIESQRQAARGVTQFVATLRGDVHFEEDDGAVAATGYVGP